MQKKKNQVLNINTVYKFKLLRQYYRMEVFSFFLPNGVKVVEGGLGVWIDIHL
jgi:hypothetical protein